MKIFRELIIILGIYLIGILLSHFLNLPIPGNILSMLILLIALITKVIKLEYIETVSTFFLDHLAFFFIPAGVGLLTSFDILRDSWLKLGIICLVSTAFVIATTGLIVQNMLKNKESEELI